MSMHEYRSNGYLLKVTKERFETLNLHRHPDFLGDEEALSSDLWDLFFETHHGTELLLDYPSEEKIPVEVLYVGPEEENISLEPGCYLMFQRDDVFMEVYTQFGETLKRLHALPGLVHWTEYR